MKVVRISEGVVFEVLPEEARPVEKWYGAAFAAQCHEAPDEVEQGWVYDVETGAWSPHPAPVPPGPSPLEDADAMMVDHEYRITLLELGVI